ncbi:hypothetical protein ANCDUO_24073, partial [Ancylostoma duodenale]
DTVKCAPMRLSYLDPLPNVTVPLEFVQGEDVIDSTEVSIYSCPLLAADCSSCIYIASSWSCSWCSGRCSHDCPQPAQEVVCDRPLITSGSSSGPIRIAIGRTSTRAAESVMLYSFVEVTVFSAYPLFGPVSGGTKITLHGQNLDAGSNVTVQVGSAPCNDVVGANFDAVLTARMFFVSSTAPPFEVVSKLSSCQIQNATFMFCLTPELLPGPYSRTAYARYLSSIV